MRMPADDFKVRITVYGLPEMEDHIVEDLSNWVYCLATEAVIAKGKGRNTISDEFKTYQAASVKVVARIKIQNLQQLSAQQAVELLNWLVQTSVNLRTIDRSQYNDRYVCKLY